MEFEQLLATTQVLPYPLSGVSPATHFLLTEQPEFAPGDRIYLYADYYIPGEPWSGFAFLLFSLSADCTLNMVEELDGTPLVAEPILDKTGDDPLAVEQAPYMGAGEGLHDQGINVWDITELPLGDPDCAATALSSVDYSPGEIHFVFWMYSAVFRVVRAFRLYRGRVALSCD
ncbi:MAG: hypothetical protein R3A51_05945 [Nannocystaceae bacterium]|nr:hypothetical protein [Myxococcales bacterium]